MEKPWKKRQNMVFWFEEAAETSPGDGPEGHLLWKILRRAEVFRLGRLSQWNRRMKHGISWNIGHYKNYIYNVLLYYIYNIHIFVYIFIYLSPSPSPRVYFYIFVFICIRPIQLIPVWNITWNACPGAVRSSNMRSRRFWSRERMGNKESEAMSLGDLSGGRCPDFSSRNHPSKWRCPPWNMES